VSFYIDSTLTPQDKPLHDVLESEPYTRKVIVDDCVPVDKFYVIQLEHSLLIRGY
jgi:hypothetical protein